MAWKGFRSLALLSGLGVAALSATPALSQDVVRIGAPLALTGALADSGKKQKLGFDLWLERVNKSGGIKTGGKTYKVELVSYDYQTDGKRAGELAEKLINDDKVSFMIAPFGSGHTDRSGRLIRGGARPGLQALVWNAGALERPDRGYAHEIQGHQA
jgi:branched-chain amino acid transport system substrate-binding protein